MVIDRDDAWWALQDPFLPAQALEDIAAEYPEFGVAVANHPGAQPGLLEWLRDNGTTEAQVAAKAITRQYWPYQSAVAPGPVTLA